MWENASKTTRFAMIGDARLGHALCDSASHDAPSSSSRCGSSRCFLGCCLRQDEPGDPGPRWWWVQRSHRKRRRRRRNLGCRWCRRAASREHHEWRRRSDKRWSGDGRLRRRRTCGDSGLGSSVMRPGAGDVRRSMRQHEQRPEQLRRVRQLVQRVLMLQRSVHRHIGGPEQLRRLRSGLCAEPAMHHRRLADQQVPVRAMQSRDDLVRPLSLRSIDEDLLAQLHTGRRRLLHRKLLRLRD